MTPQKRGRNIMTKAKGLRTVKLGSIDLKWGILASEGFEEEAREYLRGQKVLVGGRLPGAFEILSTFVDSDVKIRSFNPCFSGTRARTLSGSAAN